MSVPAGEGKDMAIDSLAALREVYAEPNARAGLKVLDHLDGHCRKFIALSPLCVISSLALTAGRTLLRGATSPDRWCT